MFFISLSYAHNLAFATTFVFVSVIMTSSIFTHYNISQVNLKNVKGMNGKPGESGVEVFLSNESRYKKTNIQIFLDKHSSGHLSLDPGASLKDRVLVDLPRGKYSFSKIKITTRFPFGLFYSWKNIRTSCSFYTYPFSTKKSLSLGLPHASLSREDGGTSLLVPGGDEFVGHQKYFPGNPWKYVDWKAYARERGLFSKMFDEESSKNFIFDFDKIPYQDAEKKIEQLAAWVEKAESCHFSYTVLLPTKRLCIGPGRGGIHFHRCMRALASWKSRESVV